MKNTHLEHPEDSILSGDLSVLDWFTAGGDLSVKIDGAPAVVWGTNPATGKFFVGTKSVFNKVKIKINESHEDIDANHQGNVAQILHCCLDSLPRIAGIVQGDFIGFGGLSEYTPNTITYQFPEVITQSIIIAPHTCYVAKNDLRDAVAIPDFYLWIDTSHVKFVKPEAYIAHGQDSFADVKEVCDFARQMSTMCQFVQGKQLANLKKQLNAKIREGLPISDTDTFDCDPNLIRLWSLVKSIKDDCLFLCRNYGPAAYLNSNRIDAEGYVLTNQFGMMKLVNREVFSHANFNLAKNW
ncbi:MAG: hypothetical protein EBU90_08595 [Proteobacteria bacterium]|jgi:Family of unknown function (DUF6267)|nr:hypothetical protein [Pseudomonadota bacterium]